MHDGRLRRHDFAAVDHGDTHDLVAMMDATDAWPAVTDARAWVLEQSALDAGAVVVDAGCGPGTFGTAAERAGASAVDVDTAVTMLAETRRRRIDARPVLGDVTQLPLRTGTAHLVRAERVLQWTPDPQAALVELLRVAAPGGAIAVTDTDWGTLTVAHRDPDATDRLAAAALRWVPHPRIARDLPAAVAALGTTRPDSRIDTVVITAWDPDDPAQRDGPPGLPLHTIAAAAATERDRARLDRDLGVLAGDARAGRFHATLELVTVFGRR